MSDTHGIDAAYQLAREQYAANGVDTEAALAALRGIPISLHCWQGDDVGGFENAAGLTDGGIQATGNYPGKARNAEELRADLDQALRHIPGRQRLNLHAIYAETFGRSVPRDELAAEHFAGWVEWARQRQMGLDFNGTFFSHPLSADGFTLAHRDETIRRFWVRHGITCRRIGEHFGRELGTPSVVNVWIPDGYKDLPVDRLAPRERLRRSLDEMFAEELDSHFVLDAVESKLFGLGSESYVVGSHEFYLGYAIVHHKLLCLDAGHFHPTESIADKLSAVLPFVPGVLLHVSRGVRWDSDHVVLLTDEVRAIAEEIVRGRYLDRVHLGLDYFDASINRVAAWVIGTRAMLKALLIALLEPTAKLRELEAGGDYTARLALLEESKTMSYGAVWDEHCRRHDVAMGGSWLDDVRRYAASVQGRR